MYTCAECRQPGCSDGDETTYPRNCPSAEAGGVLPPEYADPETAMLARNAALVEAFGYCRLTRLEEIMEFARRCGFDHLGIAHCIGLRSEATVVARVFRANGFRVDSVVCKNAALPKERLELGDEAKCDPGMFETMCNPIGQAQGLARAGTELNVMIGLCVGHDSLFMRHSVAPVTVLAVKDRVLGHNPLAAVYQADSYYHDKLFPQKTPGGQADEGYEAPVEGGAGDEAPVDAGVDDGEAPVEDGEGDESAGQTGAHRP